LSLNSPTKAPQQTEGQNAQFGRCGALVGELRDKLCWLPWLQWKLHSIRFAHAKNLLGRMMHDSEF
jgi:hypothetical protein